MHVGDVAAIGICSEGCLAVRGAFCCKSLSVDAAGGAVPFDRGKERGMKGEEARMLHYRT